jgi:DNA polymerase-3 subunit alpha
MSSITIDDIILYAIANKQKYVCLTDFNMYGAMEFYNKAHQNNLIPLIGLHIVFNNQDVYFIAKNNRGYKNLLKISSNIMTNQSFDIENHIDSLFVIADDIDKVS